MNRILIGIGMAALLPLMAAADETLPEPQDVAAVQNAGVKTRLMREALTRLQAKLTAATPPTIDQIAVDTDIQWFDETGPWNSYRIKPKGSGALSAWLAAMKGAVDEAPLGDVFSATAYGAGMDWRSGKGGHTGVPKRNRDDNRATGPGQGVHPVAVYLKKSLDSGFEVIIPAGDIEDGGYVDFGGRAVPKTQLVSGLMHRNTRETIEHFTKTQVALAEETAHRRAQATEQLSSIGRMVGKLVDENRLTLNPSGPTSFPSTELRNRFTGTAAGGYQEFGKYPEAVVGSGTGRYDSRARAYTYSSGGTAPDQLIDIEDGHLIYRFFGVAVPLAASAPATTATTPEVPAVIPGPSGSGGTTETGPGDGGGPGSSDCGGVLGTGEASTACGPSDSQGPSGSTSPTVPVVTLDQGAALQQLLGNYQSLQDELLYGQLGYASRRFDEAELRSTPEGRAKLEAMRRLQAATQAGAGNSGSEAGRVYSTRDMARELPEGVTEDMVASAEKAILYRQITANGGYLHDHMGSAGLAPTEDAAVARAQLTAEVRAPEDARRVVDLMWRNAVTEQGAVMRAALSRLPPEAKGPIASQESTFQAAYADVLSKLDRFTLALGEGQAGEEAAALEFHRALFAFDAASLALKTETQRLIDGGSSDAGKGGK